MVFRIAVGQVRENQVIERRTTESIRGRMKSIFLTEPMPGEIRKTLFLAGPATAGGAGISAWRKIVLDTLETKKDFADGIAFVPETKRGDPVDWKTRLSWEQEALKRSDVVLFWITQHAYPNPEGLFSVFSAMRHLPMRGAVFGCDEENPCRPWLSALAEAERIPLKAALEETAVEAIKLSGTGGPRCGGETRIPLRLWKEPHFQSWVNAQKNAGNRLDDASVELEFWVGPEKNFLLYWGVHADLYVKEEDRHKVNEIVISRPDICHVVAYRSPVPDNILDTEVVLIKEFRSTATTADGFIREVPGGSGYKPEDPATVAVDEFLKETGLTGTASIRGNSVESGANRDLESELKKNMKKIDARQLAGTTSAHKAHLYALPLPRELFEEIRKNSEKPFGEKAETERTYPEIHRLRELVAKPLTDWSNLGMIFTALQKQEKENKTHE
jgi:hypothetical protein